MLALKRNKKKDRASDLTPEDPLLAQMMAAMPRKQKQKSLVDTTKSQRKASSSDLPAPGELLGLSQSSSTPTFNRKKRSSGKSPNGKSTVKKNEGWGPTKKGAPSAPTLTDTTPGFLAATLTAKPPAFSRNQSLGSRARQPPRSNRKSNRDNGLLDMPVTSSSPMFLGDPKRDRRPPSAVIKEISVPTRRPSLESVLTMPQDLISIDSSENRGINVH